MRPLRLLFMACLFLVYGIGSASAQSQVFTVAGCNGCAFNNPDGLPASQAFFNGIKSVVQTVNGDLYLADAAACRVWRIDAATNIVHLVAGNGLIGGLGDGGLAVNAELSSPRGICFDAQGNLYIAQISKIRKVDAVTGIISTVAGGGSGFTEGAPATSVAADPWCAYADQQGNIYTSQFGRLFKIDAVTGAATTIAGTGNYGPAIGDGGLATNAQIGQFTYWIEKDAFGNLFFIDEGNRIRRVDATTGIITTVAGGGSILGDGVLATNVQFNAECFQLDPAGNIYIAAQDRIRKVDVNTGIINTIAGGGNSQSEGEYALNAYTPHSHIYLDLASSNLYYSNNNVVKKITNLVGQSSGLDSFNVYISKSCNGPAFMVVTGQYVPGVTLKTFFGDGTDITSNILPGYNAGCAAISHLYPISGAYNIKHVLYYGANAVDSMEYGYHHEFCSTMSLQFYYDDNSNCSYDIGADHNSFLPILVEIDSNNIPVDTISCTSGFTYTAYGNVGDEYKFNVLELPGNMIATCPVTGVVSDILQPGVNPTKYLGISCPTVNTFDYGVYAAIPVTGAIDQWGHIYVTNTHCYGPNTTITLSHSPKYHYIGGANPTPVSYNNNTITWDLNNINASNIGPVDIYFMLWQANGPLIAGDTVHNHITVNPIIGDSNPQDNSIVVIDTVDASLDPNAIYVKPEGCIDAGTNLEYKITFENVGNAPAENIYVLDTLPAGVDPSSMKVKFASHNMYVEKIYNYSQVILKFKFPNIMLPDSSDHEGCHGMFIYTIDSKDNLPSGAMIDHRVGIYFDYNDPVMTNTAQTMICWPANVASVERKNKVVIFPNPTDNELVVQSPVAHTTCTITNNIGQVLQQHELKDKEVRLNVKSLPTGIYYINVRGNGLNEVKKFLKQ